MGREEASDELNDLVDLLLSYAVLKVGAVRYLVGSAKAYMYMYGVKVVVFRCLKARNETPYAFLSSNQWKSQNRQHTNLRRLCDT